jgi:hypothetical protein
MQAVFTLNPVVREPEGLEAGWHHPLCLAIDLGLVRPSGPVMAPDWICVDACASAWLARHVVTLSEMELARARFSCDGIEEELGGE